MKDPIMLVVNDPEKLSPKLAELIDKSIPEILFVLTERQQIRTQAYCN